MKSVLLITSSLLFSVLSFAQAALTGSLSGVIIDQQTKETIIGANVLIKGTDLGTSTDFDGFYAIQNIPVGKYTVQVSYIGYDNITITDFEVKPGERNTLDVVMNSGSLTLNEITVTEYKKTNTVSAVLLEVKQAKAVVSGVSSQQMSRSQDNNAAQVMVRIPGITVIDGKFVMIRGLSERYNNVMVNNVLAPSTEIDKRTFSFDLIPTNALDRMLIYKSGSAAYPGDYAGGVIKLFTAEDVEQNFTRLTLGTAYRVNTTGQDYWQSKGSPTDFLGFDNGFRQLPSSFPDTETLKESARNATLRQTAAYSLNNNFQPLQSVASPDYSLGVSFGRNLTLAGKKLSTITNLNYSNSYQFTQRSFNRYFDWNDQSRPIDLRYEFNDDSYERQNRISLLSNWKLRLSDNSRITFKNLFNQIGENETILRTGDEYIQRPDNDLAYYLMGYRSRSIYMGQLEGTHKTSEQTELHWVAGLNYLSELEPDLRRFRTFRPRSQGDQNYTMIHPPSSNLFDTGRYFGRLREYSVNMGLDYAIKLPALGNGKTQIKTGVFGDFRDRYFGARYISYLYPGFFNNDTLNRLAQLPLDQIFSNENIRTRDGWVLEEGTRGIDSYDAYNLTTAAYASGETSLGRLDLSAGLRTEFNRQYLSSLGDNGRLIVDNPTLALLPFLNTAYNLSDKSLLRLSYSLTVNRPEFRELAPFNFYDFKLDANRVGEPNLQMARINNVDVRFETYPRPGETFSFGTFYKYFINPIENRTIISTELPIFSYINASWAQNYGVELEFRKSLRGLTKSAFLSNFSFNANASLIFSEVDLGEGVSMVQDQIRPLQGQSPYIVNFALYYEEPVSNTNIALAYNIFGDRIFSVGDRNFPTIYELSRNSLDFTLTKRIQKVSYKLGVQNLLDAPFRFYEDSNRDEMISPLSGNDNPILVFRRGQLATLSVTFDLN